ncbi:DNA lyase [Phaeobacter sp. S60]|uniref:8-oxoguanine DNA glycosylase n=1 Tax=Phaeobacter sp. S60 TaxID=1569353 RepID=UPI00058C0434|nr:DNA lyase [Phaeobacter sp. S60]KII15428.1 DNA lyase [Phaeobacter sp. S60]
MSYEGRQLQSAVASICPDIENRVSQCRNTADERALWWELSACVLSSQVPYALATAAADAIDKSGVLYRSHHCGDVGNAIHGILRTPLKVGGRERLYRFPLVRAVQLERIHSSVLSNTDSLSTLLTGFATANQARRWLVDNAHGIGPKQASMFLRNVALTYDLAIIDRHVLDYMSLTGLHSKGGSAVNSLKHYLPLEDVLRVHAEDLKCPVGILDWAIWIVMRIAKQQKRYAQ